MANKEEVTDSESLSVFPGEVNRGVGLWTRLKRFARTDVDCSIWRALIRRMLWQGWLFLGFVSQGASEGLAVRGCRNRRAVSDHFLEDELR